MPSTSGTAQLAAKVRSNCRFRKVEFEEPDVIWKGSLASPPEEELSPLEYFRTFVTDELIRTIREQSSIYAHQKDGVTLNTSVHEIEQFLAILLNMGIVKMPSIRLYWANECRFPPVADLMSRNRFMQLLKYFHMADNQNLKLPGDPLYDRLYKLRPMLHTLQTALHNIPPEEELSIDEQIIPFKGRSSIKQYIKNKPHKWGYKCFTVAGASGLMYDFKVYTGKDTCADYGLGFSGNIVMSLCENIPKGVNHKIFADNWFSSLHLATALKSKGFCFLGTIRTNRMGKCQLKSEAVLKKNGRGSFDHIVETNENLSLVRWFDRKSINFVSTFTGIEPLDNCKRWSKEIKSHVDIPRPYTVKLYNKFMGGVDLCDMLLELYRIDVRSKKWYMRIVYWCLGVAVVNSWLLYRRHEVQRGRNHKLTLLQFQSSIAQGLALAGKVIPKKRGRPSAEAAEEQTNKKQRKVSIMPTNDIRYDKIEHFPSVTEQQGRCKMCPSGFTKMKCVKCNVNLCLTVSKNCFINFHSK